MAKVTMVLGISGSGKSASLRTLIPASTFIIKPNAKDLSFPGSAKHYTTFDQATGKGNVMELKELAELKAKILWLDKAPHIKTIVLEDLSHHYTKRILSNKFVADDGYKKWQTFGMDVFNAIFANLTSLRSDLTIIILQHTEIRKDGTIADKTSGKLISDTIDIPSWCTVVLHAMTVEKADVTHYVFQTNKAGQFLAKSPAGMFKDLYIRNDMAEVLKAQEDYYSGKPQGEVKFI